MRYRRERKEEKYIEREKLEMLDIFPEVFNQQWNLVLNKYVFRYDLKLSLVSQFLIFSGSPFQSSADAT